MGQRPLLGVAVAVELHQAGAGDGVERPQVRGVQQPVLLPDHAAGVTHPPLRGHGRGTAGGVTGRQRGPQIPPGLGTLQLTWWPSSSSSSSWPGVTPELGVSESPSDPSPGVSRRREARGERSPVSEPARSGPCGRQRRRHGASRYRPRAARPRPAPAPVSWPAAPARSPPARSGSLAARPSRRRPRSRPGAHPVPRGALGHGPAPARGPLAPPTRPRPTRAAPSG